MENKIIEKQQKAIVELNNLLDISEKQKTNCLIYLSKLKFENRQLKKQINFDLQTAILKTQTEKDNLKCIKSI